MTPRVPNVQTHRFDRRRRAFLLFRFALVLAFRFDDRSILSFTLLARGLAGLCSRSSFLAPLLLPPLLEVLFPNFSLFALSDLRPAPDRDDREVAIVLLHRIQENWCRSGS